MLVMGIRMHYEPGIVSVMGSFSGINECMFECPLFEITLEEMKMLFFKVKDKPHLWGDRFIAKLFGAPQAPPGISRSLEIDYYATNNGRSRVMSLSLSEYEKSIRETDGVSAMHIAMFMVLRMQSIISDGRFREEADDGLVESILLLFNRTSSAQVPPFLMGDILFWATNFGLSLPSGQYPEIQDEQENCLMLYPWSLYLGDDIRMLIASWKNFLRVLGGTFLELPPYPILTFEELLYWWADY